MLWPLMHSVHCASTASVQVHSILISPRADHRYSFHSSSSASWQPPTCFLPLWIYLPGMFYINGVVQDVTFASDILFKVCLY